MVEFRKANLEYPRGSQYIAESHVGVVYLNRDDGIWYICRGLDKTRFNNPCWNPIEPHVENVNWFICYWYSYNGLRTQSTVRMKKVEGFK